MPGSRSIHRAWVSSMSSDEGAKTSKASRPPGTSRSRAARSAATRSASSSGRCRYARKGHMTSATRSVTGGRRKSPTRRSRRSATPAASARARQTSSMPSERSTPITRDAGLGDGDGDPAGARRRARRPAWPGRRRRGPPPSALPRRRRRRPRPRCGSRGRRAPAIRSYSLVAADSARALASLVRSLGRVLAGRGQVVTHPPRSGHTCVSSRRLCSQWGGGREHLRGIEARPIRAAASARGWRKRPRRTR